MVTYTRIYKSQTYLFQLVWLNALRYIHTRNNERNSHLDIIISYVTRGVVAKFVFVRRMKTVIYNKKIRIIGLGHLD